MNDYIMPSFFVVGSAKSGTTSLNYYLSQNPHILMPSIKEPHFFSTDLRCQYFGRKYKRDVCFNQDKYFSSKKLKEKHIAFIEKEKHYKQLFLMQGIKKISGEVSNGYLYSKVAAENIYKFNSQSKIIIILRNPAKRAFSHWLMAKRGGNEREGDFIKAIETDLSKKEKGWGISHLYIELGLYYAQIQRYKALFPESQLLIMQYEEYIKNPQKATSEIFHFLEVEANTSNINFNTILNSAALPRHPSLSALIENGNRLIGKKLHPKIKFIAEKIFLTNKDIPKITKSEFTEVNKYFIDDINSLKGILNINFDLWEK